MHLERGRTPLDRLLTCELGVVGSDICMSGIGC
jgi:hypothetical protein